MDKLYTELKQFGAVKINDPMAKHTTIKVGGPAKYLVEVTETEKLVAILKYLDSEGVDHLVIGGGSNLLFSDHGYDGVVVKVLTAESEVNGNVLMVGAGMMLSKVIMLAAQSGLSGLEWAVGVPGSIGGAVYGNAGAYGSDVSRTIEKVEAYRDGEVITLTNQECGFYYRGSDFKHHGGVVLRIFFKLVPGDKQAIMKVMQDTLKQRLGKSPQGMSAGCFFKNIKLENWKGDQSVLPEKFLEYKKVGVAWLVEQCGLKGEKVGHAFISPQHANYIMNDGQATSSEVMALVEKVKQEVYDKYGVDLEYEVQVIENDRVQN